MPRSSFRDRFKSLDRLLGFDRHPAHSHDGDNRHDLLHEQERLLPGFQHGHAKSAIPPADVTRVCLRLRHLIKECVPCEMKESLIVQPHSRIITPGVLKAAKEAGKTEHRGCVVFALLVNMRWFKHEALVELWDADLHKLRAQACTVIAKSLIENEDDSDYLMHQVLLQRYSTLSEGEPTGPANVIERAVDLHAIPVIGSSGYQKCISYLWRGWLTQDEDDPSVFIDYQDKANPSFMVHMDPDRMRAPMYQNAAQMLFSIIYLALYTVSINSVNPLGHFDGAEIVLYIFTLGYILDELVKFYKAGYHILGFWNAFNGLLYSFLLVSFILRVVGLHSDETEDRESHRNRWSTQGYNMMAFIAPMFWSRLLLYLDSFRFFGAMLVVLKVMMKESVIFFALLFIIIIGFLQAFIGLDITEDNVAGDVRFIIESMLKAIMQSPEFEGFENFGQPWGIILYYCFTFVVMIVLLNILIALYNSAYEDIYQNADDEYLALFAQKTMQFVRAPDENVYIAPLNLVEVFVSILFEWWMDRKTYEFINDAVMGTLYSPVLFVAAFFETRTARSIRSNRARGEDDDDVEEEWDQQDLEMDFEAEGWVKKCDSVKPDVETEPAVLEMRKLKKEVDELKSMLVAISKAVSAGAPETSTSDGKAVEKESTEASAETVEGKPASGSGSGSSTD